MTCLRPRYAVFDDLPHILTRPTVSKKSLLLIGLQGERGCSLYVCVLPKLFPFHAHVSLHSAETSRAAHSWALACCSMSWVSLKACFNHTRVCLRATADATSRCQEEWQIKLFIFVNVLINLIIVLFHTSSEIQNRVCLLMFISHTELLSLTTRVLLTLTKTFN